MINRKPYDQKVDMWSIGVTCYLLLCGDTPFNGKNRQQLFRRISCDEATFNDDKWGHVSDEGVEFVRGLLTKDPAKRLSAAGALSHRWLTENNSMAHAHHVQPSSLESSEELLDTKRRAAKSPSKAAASAVNHHSNDVPSRRPSLSKERPLSNRSVNKRSTSRENTNNRSVSRERIKNRSVSRDRTNSNRSVSRDRTNTNRSITAPPPPPKPQAPPRESAAKEQMNRSGGAIDENARLLDVIKNQDAKIEKLERMVKRMLEPEGDVHEC